MTGYWAYKLNYEEYVKKQAEIDEAINSFITKTNSPKEKVIDSAFLVKLDTSHFESDCSPVEDYYFVVCGYDDFSLIELEKILYPLYNEYRKNSDLIYRGYATSSKKMKETFSVDELETLYIMNRQFPIINSFDTSFTPEPDFHAIISGQDSSYGEIIKKYL